MPCAQLGETVAQARAPAPKVALLPPCERGDRCSQGHPGLGGSCGVSILLPRRGQDQTPCRRSHWGLRDTGPPPGDPVLMETPRVHVGRVSGRAGSPSCPLLGVPTSTWTLAPLLSPPRCAAGRTEPVTSVRCLLWAGGASRLPVGAARCGLAARPLPASPPGAITADTACLRALCVVCVAVVISMSTIRRDTGLPSPSLLTLS